MKIQKSRFTCLRDGLAIRGFEYRPEGERLPIAIVSQGFMSGHIEADVWAKRFAQKGYAAYSFDFNGGAIRCASDGKSVDMSVLTEVEDLKAVISYVSALRYTDNSNLTLVGCSQGGLVSALTAAQLKERVHHLILLYPALHIPDAVRSGKLMMNVQFDPENVPEQLAIGPMKIGRVYLEDALSLSPYEQIREYRGPVMILHGTADTAVNVAYAKEGYVTYTCGNVPEKVVKEPLGDKEIFAPLPKLPEGVKPKKQVQLKLLPGVGHGFAPRHVDEVMEEIFRFLEGFREVLTIDVKLTGHTMERKWAKVQLELPFEGVADGPYFQGEIQPGAKDVQHFCGLKAVSKCADYEIVGTDYTGESCKVHIINRDNGQGWKPEVTTDSKALSFLNGADLTAVLDNRKSGPIVRIYGR